MRKEFLSKSKLFIRFVYLQVFQIYFVLYFCLKPLKFLHVDEDDVKALNRRTAGHDLESES